MIWIFETFLYLQEILTIHKTHLCFLQTDIWGFASLQSLVTIE